MDSRSNRRKEIAKMENEKMKKKLAMELQKKEIEDISNNYEEAEKKEELKIKKRILKKEQKKIKEDFDDKIESKNKKEPILDNKEILKNKENLKEDNEEMKKKKKKKFKLNLFKKKDNKTEKRKNPKKKKVNVSNRRKEVTKKKKKSGIIRGILITFLTLCLLGIASITMFMIYIVTTTEDFDPNKLKNQDRTVVYDVNGNEFATLGAEKRESIVYNDLPQVLIDAIVATEDSRFYQHNGVDMARFMKASILQLLGKNDAGGASTLTMQVVKNNLTSRNSTGLQGIIRKFKDVYLSVFFVEKEYTKNEILEMYVNDSCLGGRIYGVEEASKYYFGKSAKELSLPEAALIAGMYQAPNRYDPFKHPEAAEKRRRTVLNLMVRHEYITSEERDMANSVKVEDMLAKTRNEVPYQGYLDTVIEEIKNKTGDDPTLVSMKIYTALNREIQDGINNVLNGTSYSNWTDDKIQAGIAITNVNDGTIVAIGAGRNRKASDWNYATQARRQPGSTAKPLFDYGPGFEYNNFSTYTLFNDESWNYTNGPEIGNWDGRFEGLITLRRALSVSRNIPALKAFQQVSKNNIVKFVNGLGLDVALNTSSENYKTYPNGGDNAINEAYSLGGVSNGYTPLEMAEAYATFANGGYHIESHAVTKIEYRETGKTVDFSSDREKVMSDSTAYLINNVLQYAVEYAFNGGAKVYGSTVAAKTGTSNLPEEVIKKYGLPYGAVNDLWTVAYTPEYSVALWYGYEKVDSNHYLGGASAPKDNVMKAVMKCIPKTTKKWNMPSSVVQVTVEKESWPAKLPSKYTPDNMKTTEYFKKGTQPTEISDRYEKFDKVTNLRSEKVSNGYKLTWDWKTPNVLTSSYLGEYFNNKVYGKESAKYLKQRIDYNQNYLGDNGFGIYIKESNGTLKQIGFTKNNEYIYKPNNRSEVIVVKAEYKNFKENQSDGEEITIKNDGFFPIQDELNVKLNGEKIVSVKKGSYLDDGIAVIYNESDVTSSANIKYIVNNKSFDKKNELENYINTSNEKKYEIIYQIKYKGKLRILKRTINII